MSDDLAETTATKFEICDHAVFYFDVGKDEPMRRESLDPDAYDLIAKALRSQSRIRELERALTDWYIARPTGPIKD